MVMLMVMWYVWSHHARPCECQVQYRRVYVELLNCGTVELWNIRMEIIASATYRIDVHALFVTQPAAASDSIHGEAQ